MTDVLTPEQRKLCMSNIRGKDTKPELVVRQMIHAMGFRYRLHRADLPGKPDLTFPRLKKVIFVHGCFWHMHTCRYGRVKPATNPAFWESKRQSNKTRDAVKRKELQRMGWTVLVIWECWTKDLIKLHDRILSFLKEGY
ncbi:MAG: very short patch repair endonuclease [Candidatus Aenigmarchaeota archaeon]|nr:very short patch repair endonuclease [Candidatus Aenigmarchaeota archaeon]